MDEIAGTNLGTESATPEINAGQGETGERGETGQQGEEQLKERIVKVGNNLFKILVQEFPPDTQLNASAIVNTALFLSCIVQNSLYKPEDRKSFIKIFTDGEEQQLADGYRTSRYTRGSYPRFSRSETHLIPILAYP
jgi:hypothetical protein